MVTESLVADPAASEEVASPAPRTRGRLYDALAVVVLLALFAVVHDVGNYLRTPYFLDEAWVALSTRFPLSDLPQMTASTPVGFSFLLRLLPDNDLRLLPLFFHLVAIVAAYALGRMLAPGSTGMARIAGIGCAAWVLLLPIQQIRHDLKQYTADAAITLVLLALAAWTEAGWSRRRLGVMVGVVTVATLISSVTAIAAACAFGGLVLASLVRRQWRQFLEASVAAAVAGAILLAALFGSALRGRNQELQDYWKDFFPTIGQLPDFLNRQFASLWPLLGAGSPLRAMMFSVLCVLGVVTVLRWSRPGTAIAIVLVPVASLVLGLARIYPLLDMRTSHFLFVTLGAAAGLGVVGIAVFLANRLASIWPRALVIAAALTLIAVGANTVVNRQWLRYDGGRPGDSYRTPMSMEDSRSAAEYVAAHRAPNDVIVVNVMARYGFFFYWKPDKPHLVRQYGNTVGWAMDAPDQPSLVTLEGQSTDAIRPYLERALNLAAQRGGGAKVWLVRSHVQPNEQAAWQQVLVDYNLQQVTNGVEPVYLISRKA